MYTPWIKDNKSLKNEEIKIVNQIIDVISRIRSFKNELNISPGSFVEISIKSLSKKKQDLFVKNQIMLKKLGRISSIFLDDSQKKAANLVISGEILKIYFDETVDLNLIRENLVNKLKKLSNELQNIGKKLDNRSFIEKAPYHIVEKEKNTYNELKIDIDKINLTIKSLV